jgi:hypothetical protein
MLQTDLNTYDGQDTDQKTLSIILSSILQLVFDIKTPECVARPKTRLFNSIITIHGKYSVERISNFLLIVLNGDVLLGLGTLPYFTFFPF